MVPDLPALTPPAQTGIGVIAPFDFALDRELWRWVPDHVSLHLTRLPYLPDPVTVRLAAALGHPHGVRRATRDLLVPRPSVVAYACTSGSFAGGAAGEAALVRGMREAGAPAAVTTSGALVRACAELGVRRLAVVTPYVAEVAALLHAFLAEHGVTTRASVDLGRLGGIWRTTYADVLDAVASLDLRAADALFVSCTNVPTFDLVGPLRRRLRIPVLTANQVTMHAAVRLASPADRLQDLPAAEIGA
ncbi:maleate isomerase [Amycolatopsis arida]|uniref:Maleate isomerase n=1 Tax=Amycolatopsis arida TaxID=587909 RepID=A0A1I5YLP4_9PSEU|nr:Asp/Glu/hydantoin racemase [Amycolatopsis arida]TDX90607.1 maleate isomerase [Amycolatopsis arida]SFQ45113.1 maleate isomerase [Amycolatopsis arida]